MRSVRDRAFTGVRLQHSFGQLERRIHDRRHQTADAARPKTIPMPSVVRPTRIATIAVVFLSLPSFHQPQRIGVEAEIQRIQHAARPQRVTEAAKEATRLRKRRTLDYCIVENLDVKFFQ